MLWNPRGSGVIAYRGALWSRPRTSSTLCAFGAQTRQRARPPERGMMPAGGISGSSITGEPVPPYPAKAARPATDPRCPASHAPAQPGHGPAPAVGSSGSPPGTNAREDLLPAASSAAKERMPQRGSGAPDPCAGSFSGPSAWQNGPMARSGLQTRAGARMPDRGRHVLITTAQGTRSKGKSDTGAERLPASSMRWLQPWPGLALTAMKLRSDIRDGTARVSGISFTREPRFLINPRAAGGVNRARVDCGLSRSTEHGLCPIFDH